MDVLYCRRIAVHLLWLKIVGSFSLSFGWLCRLSRIGMRCWLGEVKAQGVLVDQMGAPRHRPREVWGKWPDAGKHSEDLPLSSWACLEVNTDTISENWGCFLEPRAPKAYKSWWQRRYVIGFYKRKSSGLLIWILTKWKWVLVFIRANTCYCRSI